MSVLPTRQFKAVGEKGYCMIDVDAERGMLGYLLPISKETQIAAISSKSVMETITMLGPLILATMFGFGIASTALAILPFIQGATIVSMSVFGLISIGLLTLALVKSRVD